MLAKLTELARDFGRGQVSLTTLREAARCERSNRRLADEILRLIAAWEDSPTAQSMTARDDLRWNVKLLVPPEPEVSPSSKRRKEPTESIYAAGLRGQQRRR